MVKNGMCQGSPQTARDQRTNYLLWCYVGAQSDRRPRRRARRSPIHAHAQHHQHIQYHSIHNRTTLLAGSPHITMSKCLTTLPAGGNPCALLEEAGAAISQALMPTYKHSTMLKQATV
jgi:hypothetical protein